MHGATLGSTTVRLELSTDVNVAALGRSRPFTMARRPPAGMARRGFEAPELVLERFLRFDSPGRRTTARETPRQPLGPDDGYHGGTIALLKIGRANAFSLHPLGDMFRLTHLFNLI
jgi:hypothetical protein